jgi:hypothetical protein
MRITANVTMEIRFPYRFTEGPRAQITPENKHPDPIDETIAQQTLAALNKAANEKKSYNCFDPCVYRLTLLKWVNRRVALFFSGARTGAPEFLHLIQAAESRYVARG